MGGVASGPSVHKFVCPWLSKCQSSEPALLTAASQLLVVAPTTPVPHDLRPFLPGPVLIWIHKHVKLSCLSLLPGGTKSEVGMGKGDSFCRREGRAPASPKVMSL